MAGKENRIGILGGGQLGRMLTVDAIRMGYDVMVLDPNKPAPAAKVGAEQITADLKDPQATQLLVESSKVTTYEIEHLNTDILSGLARKGHDIAPSPETLAIINDKLRQHEFLNSAGIPTAEYMRIEGKKDAHEAPLAFGGFPFLFKSRFGGYDGRGNKVVRDWEQIEPQFESFEGAPIYAEKNVPFVKELAVMVARSKSGDIATYPVVETRHIRNICDVVIAPAQIDAKARDQANEIGLATMQHLKGAGVFGIEMFLTEDGKVLVNEIAPRVHNSGHYTIEACSTSQFEQHVRAVMGLPLGDPSMKVPAAAMVNILGEVPSGEERQANLTGLYELSVVPKAAVHIYGKTQTRYDRKMGHITVVADTIEGAERNAKLARSVVSI